MKTLNTLSNNNYINLIREIKSVGLLKIKIKINDECSDSDNFNIQKIKMNLFSFNTQKSNSINESKIYSDLLTNLSIEVNDKNCITFIKHINKLFTINEEDRDILNTTSYDTIVIYLI
jgi:hypothetical protein